MTPAHWTVGSGMALIALAAGFTLIPSMTACGPGAATDPVLAFELVRDPAAVTLLFGEPPCRNALVTAQRTALRLDALGFIPVYCVFLISALRMAAGPRHRLLLAGAVFVLAAALCDQLEGVLLSRILDALPGDQTTIDRLFVVVRAKFALLALVTIGAGNLLIGSGRRARVITGTIALIAAAAALLLLTIAEGLMPFALFAGWLALLAGALFEFRRPLA